MEKVIDRKTKERFSIHSADLYCAGIGAILGSISSPIGYAITLLYVSYAYLRSARELSVSIFFILLCSLMRGIIPAYFYALGLAVYFVMIQLLKLKNRNLYIWLPYMAMMIAFAYSYQSYQIQNKLIILPLFTYIMMQQLFKDYTWIKKEFVLSKEILSILLFAIAQLFAEVFPIYREVFLLVALLNICYIGESITSISILLSVYFLFPLHSLELMVLAGLLSIFKAQRKVAVLLLGSFFLFVPFTIEYGLYVLIGVLGLFIIPVKKNTYTMERTESFHDHNVLKRQMSNYAGIFHLLSDYYAQNNDMQSELLSNMANALQYNADIIRKVDGNEKDCAYLKKALEGYQYEVKALGVEEPKEGCLQIQLELGNIKRGEIRSTLLPLLETLMHRKLEIEEIQSHRFLNTVHKIMVCDQIPYHIDAYADSIKNSYTSNGDTFSIFRFRQSVVCMISDGMGNGDRAMKSSRLITSIFQRMMICGLSQDSAIRCINKLVQSDTFATLDVVCFNKAQGIAYISKSAACPTFLLREDKVYEINGNALPVGIISQMQPDCFQIECQSQDEYLMVSDGVSIAEIYEWIKVRKGNTVKEDVELFSTILRSTRRMDDSTIILAKVDEI